MSLTDIELFLYGSPQCTHLVTAFTSTEREVVVELKPIENDRADGATAVKARFGEAIILSAERGPDEPHEYPLDPIGFDSCSLGERWKFVLMCGSVEWIWESRWRHWN